jgi:2-polyprenyl-3-methyl-5-hydroxy-6-metoxy-1,4-benzoquinol methylase
MKFVQKGKLLDIGCGYGIFLNAARKLGWMVTGVELSRTASEYARNVYKLDIHNGEVESVNHPECHFDVITFWDVLEHVPNPASFLNTVRSLFKKEGLIALSVPNIGSFFARFYKGKWGALRPEQHLWHFNRQSLNQLLFDQGFKPLIMAKSPFNGPNFTRLDSMVVLARPINHF